MALGIERPKLRSGPAIARQNTLLYVVLNLRALHRARERLQERLAQGTIVCPSDPPTDPPAEVRALKPPAQTA